MVPHDEWLRLHRAGRISLPRAFSSNITSEYAEAGGSIHRVSLFGGRADPRVSGKSSDVPHVHRTASPACLSEHVYRE